MSTEQIVEQFQQIVDTLKKIVAASQTIDDRVTGLERGTGDTLGALTAIQGNLQVLLENYKQQADTQNSINRHLTDAIRELQDRLLALEGRGLGDPPVRETIQ